MINAQNPQPKPYVDIERVFYASWGSLWTRFPRLFERAWAVSQFGSEL